MSNNFRLSTTSPTWPTSVVPVLGGAFGHVCPNAYALGTGMRPRAIDGAAAFTHKGQGPQSWSPPSP